MKQTIYLASFGSDGKFLVFESVEAAIKMNPVVVIEEKQIDTKEFSYCLYNTMGVTDIIQIGAWKFKLTGITNGYIYPYINFQLIDPSGEIHNYRPSNKGIYAFEEVVSKLKEIKNFSNYETFQVYEKNKELLKKIEKLNKGIEKLRIEIQNLSFPDIQSD